MASRFVIGIDLGTTNSAVSYVDTKASDQRVKVFEVPQLISSASVAERNQLPSFVYLAGDIDLAPHETILPWPQSPLALRRHDQSGATITASAAKAPDRIVVGELARAQGAKMASRMIASAKSWLCHPGVDRNAPILPWGDADVAKLSPVEASGHILAHIRDSWNHAFANEQGAQFSEQSITITVPASFDEAARDLTLKAAAAAGYPSVGLLEEPQAAFYSWIADHANRRSTLQPKHTVLVCDVGGGTTDFTLISVDDSGEGFVRTAVGDHVLLGGDNVDLTLAKIVEARLAAKSDRKLDALQWHGLVHACRLAKEALLSEGQANSTAPIVVAGRGSKLVASTLRDEIALAELQAVLLDGFFPLVKADAQLARGRGGLVEFGLPYASDPAITRHLAVFLARHEALANGGKIDAVLFNGGAMTPALLRQRVLEQIAAWQGTKPIELPVAMPELAVANGAAYFGLVRRGLASRIRGGTPRCYYVGVEDSDAKRLAVCIAAKGLEEGQTVSLDRKFELVTNRPVSFRLYSSSTRDDVAGAVASVGDGRADTTHDDSDLLELPPIVAALRAKGKSKVQVQLQVAISELGALEIQCVELAHPGEASAELGSWKLAFDMRSGGANASAPRQALAAAANEQQEQAAPAPGTDAAKQLVIAAFRGASKDLTNLGKQLEATLGGRRDEWSTATIRALFDALVEVADDRKRTAEHESRWLHLAGFCLRPGFGAALDAWRAKVMWGVFNESLCFGKLEPNRLAWWIVWRRVAGGLVKGQQEQIFDRVAPLLLPNAKQGKKIAETKSTKQELAEMWRMIGSLERLPVGHKQRLGDELVRRMAGDKGREESVHLWALSRLGARVPLYGPINSVVHPNRVRDWLDTMLDWQWPEPDKVAFAFAQLARRTGDRTRDLDDASRLKLATAVKLLPGGSRAAVLIEEVVPLDAREELVALGDTLPAGLLIVAQPDE